MKKIEILSHKINQIENMKKEGMSINGMCKNLNTSKQTLYNLVRSHENLLYYNSLLEQMILENSDIILDYIHKAGRMSGRTLNALRNHNVNTINEFIFLKKLNLINLDRTPNAEKFVSNELDVIYDVFNKNKDILIYDLSMLLKHDIISREYFDEISKFGFKYLIDYNESEKNKFGPSLFILKTKNIISDNLFYFLLGMKIENVAQLDWHVRAGYIVENFRKSIQVEYKLDLIKSIRDIICILEYRYDFEQIPIDDISMLYKIGAISQSMLNIICKNFNGLKTISEIRSCAMLNGEWQKINGVGPKTKDILSDLFNIKIIEKDGNLYEFLSIENSKLIEEDRQKDNNDHSSSEISKIRTKIKYKKHRNKNVNARK